MKNLENTIKQMLLENGSAAFARMFGGEAAAGARGVRPRAPGRGSRRPGESPEPSPEESAASGIRRTDVYGGGGMNDMVIPQSASDMFGVPATPSRPAPQMGGASRMGGGQQPPAYMDPGFAPTPMRPEPVMTQPPEQPFSMVPQQPQMGGQGMGMPQDPMVAAAADQISQQASRGNITPPKQPMGMAQDPMAMPGQQAPGMGGAPQPRQPQGGPSSATVSAQDQLGALNEPTMFDGMPQPQAQQPPTGGQGMGQPQAVPTSPMPKQPPMGGQGMGMPTMPMPQQPMGRGMPQPQAVPTSPMPKAPPMTDFGSPMPQGGMSPDFSMTPEFQPQLQRAPQRQLGRRPQTETPPQTQTKLRREDPPPPRKTATKTANPRGPIGFNFGGEETPASASNAMLRYGRGGQSQMLDPTMPTEYSQEANPMDMERMRRKQMFRQQIAQRSFNPSFNPGMAYESFMAESDKKKMKTRM